MQSLWNDLRHAVRSMARQPAASAAVLLTLALGIGANAAVFGAARAVLLAPLPFPHGERLVRLYLVQHGSESRISLAPETFLAIRERQRSFDALVAHRFTDTTLRGGSEPRRVVGMAVSEGWADALGVRPLIGRTFSPQEDREGGVVVLSYALWQSAFGGDPGVLGRTLRLDDRAHTVIGVLPPGYRFPYDADLWFPMRLGSGAATWGLNVQARLSQGVSLAQASEDLASIARGLAVESPARHRDATLIAVPTREVLVGDQGRTLVLLLGAVGFVLLIVCANLASLLLARAVGRRREMALRAALGATRWRQVRQMLTESLLLSGLGGALGVFVAWESAGALSWLLPQRLHWLFDRVPLDSTVLACTAGAAVACGVAFGLAPAVWASRRDLDAALREGARGSGSGGARRLLDGMVVAEVALALVLVAGAGLMLRNLDRLQRLDLGYDSDGLTLASVALDSPPYDDPERRQSFVEAVEEQLAALPGVRSVGTTCLFPVGSANFLASIEVEGRAPIEGQRQLVNHRLVSPGFLPTLGLRLTRGRLLRESDRARAPRVAVVNESLARRYWPGEDPIGRRVRNRRVGERAPWMTVVGEVADSREFGDTPETWYLPFAQHAQEGFAGRATFVTRSLSPPGPDTLSRAIHAVDPTQAVYDVASARSVYGETLVQQRFSTLLLGGFAVFGLFLSGLGLYAVLSYAVSRRFREIGIRVALGAGPRDVLREVLGHAGGLLAIGLLIGTLGALALSRAMSGIVTQVEPLDPVSLALALGVLCLVGLQASYLPARRAMRCDPVESLREE